jgi:hypothetical protein
MTSFNERTDFLKYSDVGFPADGGSPILSSSESYLEGLTIGRRPRWSEAPRLSMKTTDPLSDGPCDLRVPYPKVAGSPRATARRNSRHAQAEFRPEVRSSDHRGSGRR